MPPPSLKPAGLSPDIVGNLGRGPKRPGGESPAALPCLLRHDAPARIGAGGSGMDADEQEFPAGTPRRRLGNFRTADLARRVRTVLREAGGPSSDRVDPARPELGGP